MASDVTDLIYFDSDLDVPSAAAVEVTSVATPVTQHVSIDQAGRTAFLAKQYQDWCWEDLRDYVAQEITKRFGVFPRDPKKEYGIFTAFMDRWGIERAVAIAKYAYETRGGMWKGAPVRMTRFCKNSDPYFAELIAGFLQQHT